MDFFRTLFLSMHTIYLVQKRIIKANKNNEDIHDWIDGCINGTNHWSCVTWILNQQAKQIK
jgi:hypothetical protein